MEVVIICITLGMVISVLFIGIGVLIGGMDKGQLNNDSDSGLYSDSSDSECDGLDRHVPSSELIRTVLFTLRSGACETEKEVIDYLVDHIENLLMTEPRTQSEKELRVLSLAQKYGIKLNVKETENE